MGRSNIFISWPFVKICLILNYMGQCVWIIQNQNNPIIQVMEDLNPFYMMLPEAMRPLAILLSALAAIIASQALISGSYTLVREASSLDLMPHLNVQYPSDTKGQIYIPYVNNILWFFCVLVVLYFQSGSRMENAYGLAITISMLMMTVLFCVYIGVLHKHPVAAAVFGVVFFALEGVFFISSLGKFVVGGYVAIIISLMVLFIMIAWYRGTEIEQEQNIFLNMREHLDSIKKLQNDESIPLCSNNVVYLVKGDETEVIDRDILYSILDKDPKRADAYWFISVNTTNDPYQKQYEVETFGTNYIFRVNLYLGYKVRPSVNIYLRQVVHDLLVTGELPKQNKRHSIYAPSDVGSFKFCMIRKTMPQEGDIDEVDDLLIRAKYVIRRICGNPFQWFGLENSNMIIEYDTFSGVTAFLYCFNILFRCVCLDAFVDVFDQGGYIQSVSTGAFTDGFELCSHTADAAQTVIGKYLHDLRMCLNGFDNIGVCRNYISSIFNVFYFHVIHLVEILLHCYYSIVVKKGKDRK